MKRRKHLPRNYPGVDLGSKRVVYGVDNVVAMNLHIHINNDGLHSLLVLCGVTCKIYGIISWLIGPSNMHLPARIKRKPANHLI